MEISIKESQQELLLGRQDDRGAGPGRSNDPGQPDLHAAGAERLRQDHVAAVHRRPGDARDAGRSRSGTRWFSRRKRASLSRRTNGGWDGVPDLRHMAPHERLRQRGLPLQTRNEPREEIVRKVAKTLHFVQLDGFEKRPATKLSGGQQQRVTVARSWSLNRR